MLYTLGMETASGSLVPVPGGPRAPGGTDPVEWALRLEAEGLLRRATEVRVEGVSITLSPRSPTVCLPGELVRMGALSVLFGLDGPAKWEAALAAGWVPEALRGWLGVRGLDEVAAKGNVGWVAPRAFIERLGERVGEVLVELAQPRAGAAVSQTLRRLFLYRGAVQDGGLVLGTLYWKRFLRDAAKPLRAPVREEVRRRIAFALGQVERAERAPGHWRPIPGLTPEARAVLEAARGGPPPERLVAFEEAFEAGLFDFIPDLVAASYSAVGRRAYHPLAMWRVLTAMLAKGEMEAGRFVAFAGDSVHYRLYLGVRSEAELPSPRRIKGFLAERLAPVAEHLVRGLSVALVTRGGVAMGDEFGTDGVEMAAQARTKSDAALAHLRPHLEGLLASLRAWLEAEGRTDLSEAERAHLLDAFRTVDWPTLGSARQSKAAILDAVRTALDGDLVTPRARPPGPRAGPSPGPVTADFAALARRLAASFAETLAAFGPRFNWDTHYDPQGSARTKYGKTLHGFGLQFLIDLAYGFVWAFAVFPAGSKFQPHIADFLLTFQRLHGLGGLKLTSDREFTIAQALARWHAAGILAYGPRSASPAEAKGIFTEKDFDLHGDHAVCPNQKALRRKPTPVERGSTLEWRYQGQAGECAACPLRAQCTTGQGPRVLAVNAYRDDVARYEARMKADPAETRDLMARHRALVEGTANHLKHHEGTRRALWKGLALARLQFGLAILALNVAKWHKFHHDILENVKAKRASQARTA
jgi:hypothetical protein